MIKNITIEGFKCFHERQSIPLSQINLLYGKNGRGKSTIAQSFLLLAQTMKECNDIAELRLMGDWVALGTFDEVVNVNTESKKFYWAFQDDDNRIELGFEKLPQKTQMAKLCELLVNGENRFDVKTTSDKDIVSENKSVSTTSDIMMLQNFKLLQYVSAERLGPKNISARIDSLDNKVSLLTKKNNYRLWGSLDYNKYLNNDIALQVVSDYLNNKEENNKDK